jgi:hypothetical protein
MSTITKPTQSATPFVSTAPGKPGKWTAKSAKRQFDNDPARYPAATGRVAEQTGQTRAGGPGAARRDLTMARAILVLALVLAACTRIPNPYPGQPWVGPDGRVVQPPLEGWPDYTKGGRSF